MIIVPHQQQPSKRALALAARLQSAIDDFRHAEPKVTEAEIGAAIDEARRRIGGPRSANVTAAVATIVGIVVALGIGIAVSVAQRGEVPGLLWPLVVGCLAVLAAGVVLLWKLRE